MLQSEFFERTKVHLDSAEYIKIESLYNEVKMDKDEFCKQWLKLRNNTLMKEAIEAFYKSQHMVVEIAQLKKQVEEQEAHHNRAMKSERQNLVSTMEEFAKRIVRANESGDARVYDVIEEEYGLAFIIKAKHEANIPLSESEIGYMVRNL